MHRRHFWQAAVATSFLVHAVTFSGLAAWVLDELPPHVRFVGRQQTVHLTITTSELVQEPVIVELFPQEPVEIKPTEAFIAKRRYVHVPTASVPLPEFAENLPAELQPQRMERAGAPRFEMPLSDSPRVQTQFAKRNLADPVLTEPSVINPPTSLGNADETPPDLSKNAPPSYPALAIQRGWEGTVLLRLVINESGYVTDVSVEKSSGYAILDGAAVNAVRRWRGTPAIRRGQPISTTELLPVRFKL